MKQILCTGHLAESDFHYHIIHENIADMQIISNDLFQSVSLIIEFNT